jgi:hypothetical protein
VCQSTKKFGAPEEEDDDDDDPDTERGWKKQRGKVARCDSIPHSGPAACTAAAARRCFGGVSFRLLEGPSSTLPAGIRYKKEK